MIYKINASVKTLNRKVAQSIFAKSREVKQNIAKLCGKLKIQQKFNRCKSSTTKRKTQIKVNHCGPK